MAKSKRVQVLIFKDDDGKDLLRFDTGDPMATLTIARANAAQLESLADAIGQVLAEMKGTPAPPAEPLKRATPGT